MIKVSRGESIFAILNVLFLTCTMVLTLYPFLYVAFASISDPEKFITNEGLMLMPKGLYFGAYARVFDNPMISTGYLNTLFIVIAGTSLNIILTSFGAYALSRKGLYFKNIIMFFITFTMFFSGGLIPFFMVVRTLGMMDNILALIIPVAINTFNLIIMRTSFASIPDSLEESARIDGANDFTILFRIILPVAMPVVSVMLLYYGVHHWNAWFYAMIFLRNRTMYPLQLVLREIIVNNSTGDMLVGTGDAQKMMVGEIIKYATIIVATIPIICVYPFLQKHFVKGVMVGALKG